MSPKFVFFDRIAIPILALAGAVWLFYVTNFSLNPQPAPMRWLFYYCYPKLSAHGRSSLGGDSGSTR